MKEYTDFLGRPLAVGDEIVYASGASSSCHLTHAIIDALEEIPKLNYRDEIIGVKDKIVVRYAKPDRWQKPDKKIRLQSLSKAIKV